MLAQNGQALADPLRRMRVPIELLLLTLRQRG